MSIKRVPTGSFSVSALVVAALLTGCETDDGKNGEDLAGEVKTVVQQYFDSQDLGWAISFVTCEDVPVVREGAVSDCDVRLAAGPTDDLNVQVTMQDEAGHFEWHATGLLTAKS